MEEKSYLALILGDEEVALGEYERGIIEYLEIAAESVDEAAKKGACFLRNLDEIQSENEPRAALLEVWERIDDATMKLRAKVFNEYPDSGRLEPLTNYEV